jgi:hypothetical protein
MPVHLVAGLMVGGFVLLLCCALGSFGWRKDGVSSEELWAAGSNAAAHPEKYFRPDRVPVVRTMSYLGVGLWLAGVVVMVVKTIQHP